jgi:hypothetical protein
MSKRNRTLSINAETLRELSDPANLSRVAGGTGITLLAPAGCISYVFTDCSNRPTADHCPVDPTLSLHVTGH